MKKQKIDIPVHSIIMLVGATDVERDTFVKDRLHPALKSLDDSSVVILGDLDEIEKSTEYPKNTYFVIAEDGLTKKGIKSIADRNNYNLVSLIFDEALLSGKNSKKKGEIEIFIKDIDNEIVSTSHETLLTHKLDETKEWIVVGDIHGCLEEFKEALVKNGFEIDMVNNKILGVNNS